MSFWHGTKNLRHFSITGFIHGMLDWCNLHRLCSLCPEIIINSTSSITALTTGLGLYITCMWGALNVYVPPTVRFMK